MGLLADGKTWEAEPIPTTAKKIMLSLFIIAPWALGICISKEC
jgi:hypothetical protein